jgi:hypothetical protein
MGMMSDHFKPVKNIKIRVVKIDSSIEILNENSAITKFAERREFGEWRGQKTLV